MHGYIFLYSHSYKKSTCVPSSGETRLMERQNRTDSNQTPRVFSHFLHNLKTVLDYEYMDIRL